MNSDYVPEILEEPSSVPCLKGNGFSEASPFIEEASRVWGNSSLSKNDELETVT